jgi:hypothetical protein
MSNSTGSKKDSSGIASIIGASLLSHNITYTRIEFAEDVNTCFVFVSTRNVSAIDISPLEQVAKEVKAELKSVIDSDKDQLCFFFVYSTSLG